MPELDRKSANNTTYIIATKDTINEVEESYEAMLTMRCEKPCDQRGTDKCPVMGTIQMLYNKYDCIGMWDCVVRMKREGIKPLKCVAGHGEVCHNG